MNKKDIHSILLCQALLFILVGWSPLIVNGQNLVPNGSFEEYEDCPNALNQIDRALGWSRYRGSPDYFNMCADGGIMGVPLNIVGYQYPASGSAYAGLITWNSNFPNGREHVGAQLAEPLLQNTPVYISFKVSPATDGSVPIQSVHWTASGAGLRFVMSPYLQNDAAPLPNSAALYLSFAPNDTAIWYNVSGIYVPDSAYEYLVLGNFFVDDLVVSEVLNPSGTYPSAYVYYDDVCVSYNIQDCDIETGLLMNYVDETSVFPNPFADQFTLKFTRSIAHVIDYELVDPQGRPVMNGAIPNGRSAIDVNTTSLKAGTYTLRLTTSMGVLPPVVLICVKP
jgi:hypothetical protein